MLKHLISTVLVLSASIAVEADVKTKKPIQPTSVKKIVADGKHNAFTAMVKWKGSYWLSFRKADGHGYGEADLIVMHSDDTENWKAVHRVNALPDDRDPQFLATKDRLFLYVPALMGRKLTSFVTYTDDGKTWSKPQPVYRPRYIFWKPVEQNGQFYATAHVKAEGGGGGKVRAAHLITSTDGLDWKKVSVVRAGNWESETTIHFGDDGKIVAFLRQKYSVPGFILESSPPYQQWKQRPANTHLSGHSAYTFDGVTYLFSRTMEGKKMGTMLYTYEEGKLVPYCKFPSGGDCSYPAAVRIGDELLVSYYSSHEGSTNIYIARVPLKGK